MTTHEWDLSFKSYLKEDCSSSTVPFYHPADTEGRKSAIYWITDIASLFLLSSRFSWKVAEVMSAAGLCDSQRG